MLKLVELTVTPNMPANQQYVNMNNNYENANNLKLTNGIMIQNGVKPLNPAIYNEYYATECVATNGGEQNGAVTLQQQQRQPHQNGCHRSLSEPRPHQHPLLIQHQQAAVVNANQVNCNHNYVQLHPTSNYYQPNQLQYQNHQSFSR